MAGVCGMLPSVVRATLDGILEVDMIVACRLILADELPDDPLQDE